MFLVDVKKAHDAASCAAPYTGELNGIQGNSLYGFITVFGQIRRTPSVSAGQASRPRIQRLRIKKTSELLTVQEIAIIANL